MTTNSKLQLGFLLTLLGGLLLLSFFILRPFLAPIALAAIFAVILYPLYEKIRKAGWRKEFASFATVALSVLCILLPLGYLGLHISREALATARSIAEGTSNQSLIVTVIDTLGDAAEKISPGSKEYFVNISSNIDVYIKQSLLWLVGHTGTAFSGLTALILYLFIFLVTLYYLLIDGVRLKNTAAKVSPLNDRDDNIVFERLTLAINSVVKGSLLIALAQGTLTAIGFTIFGIPNAILWGTVTVIAALVPSIGTSLVLLPGIIYLFITGHTLPGVGLVIWSIFAVGLIDNLLYPKLVGKNLQIHPLLVLLSVLGGLALFGPIGIFLGPITISFLFACVSIYAYFTNHKDIEGAKLP